MQHTKSLMLSALVATAFCGIPADTYADNGKITYSANTGDKALGFFGTGKKESYDVATFFDSKLAKGKTIESIKVPVRAGSRVSNVKLWLSKKLSLDDKKKNVADIVSLDATIEDTTAIATLPTPYTIDSDTLYIGNSFDIDSLSSEAKLPITVVYNAKGGMWAHSSRTYRSWMNKASYGTAALEVILNDAADNAASISHSGMVNGQINLPTTTSITLLNHGTNGIKSVDYSYTLDGKSGNGHIDIDKPVPAFFNAFTDIDLQLPALQTKGVYPLTISIDKVNGEANADEPSTELQFRAYTLLPKRTPVMEEYTGTWCGWCPRGWVALEVMNRLHPDFIGLSYHYADIMQVFKTEPNEYPASQDRMGYPGAFMNREAINMDPYYGSANSGFGIEDEWQKSASTLAPATLEAEATFTDSGKKIAAKAHLTFPDDLTDADKYKVEFVLLADSLRGSGSSWTQHSYYTPKDSTEITFPEADILFKGNEYLNLHFNDVVVASTRIQNGLSAVPAIVEADKTLTVEGELLVDSVLNINGESIIQDSKNLRIVALLLNADGTIANGAKAKVTGAETTGIEIASDKQQDNGKPAAIYDLQGRRMSTLRKGLNIVTYPSGKARKVMAK